VYTAVGGNKFDGQQVVARQPVFAFQPPGTAPEGETADPGGRHPPTGCRQSVNLRRGVEFAPGAATTDPRGPGDRIDLKRLHRTDVDHEPVIVA
jgi:hypothetical protein